MRDVVFMIGGNALQSANRNGLAVDAAAPARRLARTVAGTPQDSREHVGLPIEDIRIVEAALRDHPDVFRHVRVRGTRPLAVDDAVVIVRVRRIRTIHGFPRNYIGSNRYAVESDGFSRRCWRWRSRRR